MRNFGIGLLAIAVLLVLSAFFAPIVLWLAAIDSPTPPAPADLGSAILIPLVCLPASVLTGVTGLVLLVAGLPRK